MERMSRYSCLSGYLLLMHACSKGTSLWQPIDASQMSDWASYYIIPSEGSASVSEREPRVALLFPEEPREDARFGILDLPEELLIHSWSYLDAPSLAACSRVCSRFRDALCHHGDVLWKTLA